MAKSIALIDDDKNILTSVSIALKAEGFGVDQYTDGSSALPNLFESLPDLVILDIKMPRMDGIELLRKIREKSDVPVIFLTSKDDEIDEVIGLRLGADDYIKKPFSQRLLIERVKALIRRQELNSDKSENISDPDVIARGDLIMDSSRHQCRWKNTLVNLTVTEFLLLKSLAFRPGYVKNRDQLIDAAYGEHIYVDDRTIDSHVKRLRKKFRNLDDSFTAIETLYGIGYRYNDDAKTK